MHPWLAVWIWSMAMARAWQPQLMVDDKREAEPIHAEVPAGKRAIALAIPANRYLKSSIIETPLPEIILDRLADLHWMEREPALAI